MNRTISTRRKRWYFARSLARAYRELLQKRKRDRSNAERRPLFAEALEPRILFSGTPVPVDPGTEDEAGEHEAIAQTAEFVAAESESGFDGLDTIAFEEGVEAEFTEADLQRLADEASARWEATGLTPDQIEALERINYVVTDLEGLSVGAVEGDTVYIDDDGGGYGWFVDGTEGLDEEFAAYDGYLDAITDEAMEGIDLLTALMHEQGHILGLEDFGDGSEIDGLMHEYVGEGERWLPLAGQAQEAVPLSLDGRHFLTASGDSADYVLQLDGAQAESVTLTDNGDGTLTAVSSLTGSTTFDVPTNSLTIAGDGDDTVVFANAIGLGGAGLEVTAGAIQLDGDVVTGGNQTYTGAVTLGADVVLDTSAGNGSVTIDGTLDGGGNDLDLVTGTGDVAVTGAATGIERLTVHESGVTDFQSGLAVESLVVATGGRTAHLTVSGGDVTVGSGDAEDDFVIGTNPGDVSGTTSRGTVDFSGATNFTADVDDFFVGVKGDNSNGGSVGVATLATNSTIAANEVKVGRSGNSGGGGNALHFGAGTNVVETPSFTVGEFKTQGARVDIADGGVITIGNLSQRTELTIGLKNAGTGATTQGIVDFSNGTSNLFVTDINLAEEAIMSGAGNPVGTLVLGDGSVDASGNIWEGAGSSREGSSTLLVLGDQTFAIAGEIVAPDRLVVGRNEFGSELVFAGMSLTIGEETNPTNLAVGTREGTSGGGSRGVLDLSALTDLEAHLGTFHIAKYFNGSGSGSPEGTVHLAANNEVSATLLEIADSTSPGMGGFANTLHLGASNTLAIETIVVGGDKGNGRIDFAAPGGALTIGASGAPVDLIIGQQEVGTSGGASGVVDLRDGTITGFIDELILGTKPDSAGGNTNGLLQFAAGALEVETVQLGVRTTAGTSGSVTGTIEQSGGVITVANGVGDGGGNSMIEVSHGAFTVNAGGFQVDDLLVGQNSTTALLTVNGGDVVIGDGVGSNFDVGRSTSATTKGTVDFGGANSVTIDVVNLRLGSNASGGNTTQGDLTLSTAGPNTVTATTMTLGFTEGGGNTAAATSSDLHLGGAANDFHIDTVTVGGRKAVGTIDMVAGGTFILAGNSNTAADLRIGHNDSTVTGTNPATSTVDLSGGTFNATLGEVVIGLHGGLSGSGQGSLTYEAGTITANTLTLSDTNVGGTSSNSQNTDGTLNHNGGSLTVGTFTFAEGDSTLNISDGTFTVTTAFHLDEEAAATEISALNLSGGTLDLSGVDIVDRPGADSFTFTGGTLKDVGNFGIDLTQNGGTLQVGADDETGTMTVDGDFTASGGVIEIEIDGTAGAGAAGGHDQIVADQTSGDSAVDLTGSTLAVELNYVPTLGDSFVILSNDESDAVTGEFNHLPEGGLVSATSSADSKTYVFTISYAGGDGNDVVLTNAGLAETLVEIDGNGNLVITDINGGASDDDITIVDDGAGNFVISDPNLVLATFIPGAVQVDANTIRVAKSDVTGGLIVDTLADAGGGDVVTLGSALSFAGDISITADTIDLYDDLSGDDIVFNGALNHRSTGTANLRVTADNVTFNGTTTVLTAGSTNNFELNVSGAVTNSAGSLFDLNGGRMRLIGDTQFVNEGDFETGSAMGSLIFGTSSGAAALTNAGTFTHNGSLLRLYVTIFNTSTGTVDFENPSGSSQIQLNLPGGAGPGAAIENAGTFRISGTATHTFAGTGPVTNLSGGVVDVTGPITVASGVDFTNDAGGNVNLLGGGYALTLDDATFTNDGTVTWVSGADGNKQIAGAAGHFVNNGTFAHAHGGTGDNLILGDSVTFTNAAGGTFDFQRNGDIQLANSNVTFDNDGLVLKSVAIGDDSYFFGNGAFHNRAGGEVRSAAGQIQFGMTGTQTTAAGALWTGDGGNVGLGGVWSGTFSGTSGNGGHVEIVHEGNAALATGFGVGAGGVVFDIGGTGLRWSEETIDVAGNSLVNTGILAIVQGSVAKVLVGGDLVNTTGTIDFSSGSVTLDGTSAIRNQSTLNLSTADVKTLAGTGSLLNESGGTVDWSEGTLEIADATTTVANDGTFSFTSTNTRTLSGDGLLVNNAGGVMDWAASGDIHIDDATLQNDGTFDWSGTGRLDIAGATGSVVNNGVIDWRSSGTLDLATAGSTFENNAGATFNFAGSADRGMEGTGVFINSGLFNHSATGADNFELRNSVTFENAGGATYDIGGAGDIRMLGSSRFENSGLFIKTAGGSDGGGTSAVFEFSHTLGAGGSFHNLAGGTVEATSGRLHIGSTGSNTSDAAATWTADGGDIQIGGEWTGTFAGSATGSNLRIGSASNSAFLADLFVGSGGVVFDISGDGVEWSQQPIDTRGNDVTNLGQFWIVSGAAKEFGGTGDFITGNGGTTTVAAGAEVTTPDGSRKVIAGGGTLTGGGTFTAVTDGAAGSLIVTGGNLTLGDPALNAFATAGDVVVHAGDTLTLRGSGLSLLGASTLVNGTLVDANGLSMSSGDEISGAGTVDAAVGVNSATVAPGESGADETGTLSILGGIDFGTGDFFIDLDGENNGDVLDVTGEVDLGGSRLVIQSIANVAAGDEIVIVRNDGVDPVGSAFAGLPEGTVFDALGQTFTISYQGGDGNDIVLAASGAVETSVALDASNNLVITDVNGDDSDDDLTITVGTNPATGQNGYTLIDPHRALTTAIPGAFRVSGNEIFVPFSAISGDEIVFDAGGGVDILTIDLGNAGGAVLQQKIVFHGGAGDGDLLRIVNGNLTRVVHQMIDGSSGTIDLDADVNPDAEIFYTGLEPVDMTGSTATDFVFNLPAGADNAQLSESGGFLTLESTDGPPTFESTTFAAPTGSITINGGAGDSLTISSPLDLSANNTALTINVEAIELDGTAINTGTSDQVYNGVVTLGNDVVLTGQNVTFTETVDSDATPRSLEVVSDGVTRFIKDVGAASQLSALTTDAAGTTEFGTAAYSALELNFDAAFDTAGNNGWNEFGTSGGRTWDFPGPPSAPFSPIAVSEPGLPGLTAAYEFPAAIATTGTFGAVLGANANATFEVWFKPTGATGSGDLEVLWESGGDGNGSAIFFDRTNNAVLVQSQSGDNNEFAASASLAAAGTGFQQVVGVLDLVGDKIDIYLNGTFVASAAAPNDFSGWDGGDGAGLGTISGTVTQDDDGTLPDQTVGNFTGEIAIMRAYSGALSADEIAANYAAITDPQEITVATTGAQNFGDDVVVGRNLTFEGSEVTFGGTLDGDNTATRSVTVKATNTAFAGAVGTTNALTRLTTDGAGTTTISGATVSTSGEQTFDDAVVLGADTVLDATVVTFGSTVATDGTDRSLTVNGGTNINGPSIDTGATGDQNFNGNVGLAAATVTLTGDDVTFSNNVNGASNLVVNAGGVTTFNGQVGNSTRLGSVTTDAAGSVVIARDVVTTGAQTFSDTATITSDLQLLSVAGGDIAFSGTLDGLFSLAVLTDGRTVFSDTVGGTSPLASLYTNPGGTVEIRADVTTSGAQDFLDRVEVFTDATLTGTDITFFNSVDAGAGAATSNLVVAASGTTRFARNVGDVRALDSLTTDGSGSTVFGVDPADTATLSTGLELFLPFETANPGEDISGNSRNGTLLGDAAIVPGFATDTVTLDGNGDRVEITGYKGVGGTDPRTMAAWIQVPATGTNTDDGGIMAWGTNAGGEKWVFRLAGDNLRVEMANGGIESRGVNVRDGNWHHVAAVYSNATATHDDVDFYIDGVLQPKTTSTAAVNTGASADVTIGTDRVTANNNSRDFNGLIDEAAIWSRALTSAEIMVLTRPMTGSITVTTSGDQTYNDVVTLQAETTLAGEDVIFSSTVDLGANDLTLSVTGLDSVASGEISGSGKLIKDGVGTFALANPTGNTYTGGTDVNGGTLLANNTSGSATGPGASSSTPVFEWAVSGGGTSSDPGRGIAVDGSGNAYVTGNYEGGATFGSTTLTSAGGADMYIAKLDASGNYEWAVSAGGGSDDIGYAIAVDGSGNAYVTGSYWGSATFGSTTLTSLGAQDTFIAKLDADGNYKWAVSGGGPYTDRGLSIAVDGSGNAYVTGSYSGSVTFGSTTLTGQGSFADTFIAKLDASGNYEWAVSGGGPYTDIGQGIAVDGSGNAYVTGRYNGIGSATFGSTTLTSAGSSDTYIAKLDTSGNYEWAVSGGGSSSKEGYGIAVDGSGNVYVTGHYAGSAIFGSTTLTSAGSSDTYIAKLDTSGNYEWAVSAGGTSTDVGFGIAVDGSGNTYMTGRYEGSATFGSTTLTSLGVQDTFIAKLDAGGNYEWAVSAGGTNFDVGRGIAVDGSGNAYVTGNYEGSATFGSTTLTSAGNADTFVAKISGGAGGGPVTVNTNGTLGGTGFIASDITVNGGTLAPGLDTGADTTDDLASGNLSLTSTSTFTVELGGTTENTDYDQIDVTGTVDINSDGNAGGGALLDLSVLSGFLPAVGNTFRIVDNDSTDPLAGGSTFRHDSGTGTVELTEGAVFTADGVMFSISYAAGTDSNDVVLTVLAPDTVYVDESFTTAGDSVDGDRETAANESAIVGYNAFSSISAAVAALDDTQPGTIVVNGGDYSTEAVDLTTFGNDISLILVEDETVAATTVSIGSLQAGAADTLVLGGSDASHPQAVQLTLGNAAASNIAGAISGTGGLTKVGTGTVTLSGTNTYGGTTTIDQGNVLITDGSALGATGGGTTINQNNKARLQISGDISVAEPITLTGAQQNAPAIQNLGGDNMVTGLLTVSGSSRISSSSRSITYTGGVSATGNQQLVVNSGGGSTHFTTNPVDLNAGTFYVDSGGLTTVGVAGNNWASTTFSSGTLRLDVDNALPSNTTFRHSGLGYGSGGTLDLNGTTQTVASLFSGPNFPSAGDAEITSATEASLTVNQAGNTTYHGIFSGMVNLEKDGAGTLSLTGSSTHSGTTTIADGTLALSGAGGIDQSAEIAIGSMGTLDVSARTGGAYVFPGDVTGTGSVSGTLTVGSDLKPGDNGGADIGTLTTDDLTIDGTLVADVDGGTGNHDQLVVVGEVTVGGALSLNFASAPSAGDVFVLIDNDGTTDAVNGTFAGFPDDHVFEATISGAVHVFQIDYTTEDGTTAPGANEGNNVVLKAFGVAETSVEIDGNGNLVITDINGGVSDDTITISEDGAGNYVITDPNLALTTSIPGATRIDGNTISVAKTQVTGGLIVETAGDDASGPATDVVTFAGSNAIGFAGDIVVNATVEETVLAQNVTSTGGDITINGPVMVGGTVAVASTTGDVVFGSTVDLGTAANTLTVEVGGTASEIQGVVSGAGALTKAGGGTLTLGSANTYAGATTISEGILKMGDIGALGDTAGGTVVADGAALDMNGVRGAFLETITINGDGIAGDPNSGALFNSGASMLNDGPRNLILGSDASIGSNGARFGLNNGTVTGAFTLTKVGTSDVWANSNVTVNNIVVDGGVYGIQGNNADNVSGAITVNANGTLGTWTNRTIDADIVFNGGRFDTASGAGTFPVTLNGAVELNGANNRFNIAATTPTTINGDVSGTGSLVKSDVGSLTLTGDNDYTGTTTVSAGTVLVNGTHSGGGDYTTAGGTVLGGTGSIAPAPGATVTIGGILATGDPAVAAGIGNLTIDADVTINSQFQLQIDGANSDTLNVTVPVEEVTLGGSSTLVVTDSADPAAGSTTFVIDNAGTDQINGIFTGLAEGATVTSVDGNEYTISYVGGDGNDVVLFEGVAETQVDLLNGDLTITDITSDSVDNLTVEIVNVGGRDYYQITEADQTRVISSTNVGGATVIRPNAYTVQVLVADVTGDIVVDTTGPDTTTAGVESGDTVTLADLAAPLAGDLSVTAESIFLNTSASALGDIDFNGDVTLGQDVALDAANISFNGKLDSDATARAVQLGVDPGGTLEFQDSVGSISQLQSLDIGPDGTTRVSGRTLLDNLATTGMLLNFDASFDPNTTDAILSDLAGSTNGSDPFNLLIDDDPAVTYTAVNSATYAGLTGAYAFPGGSGVNQGGLQLQAGGDFMSPSNISPNPDSQDATFEFWIKPDDLSGNEVIWETGGGTGTGFALEGSSITFSVIGGGLARVGYDLVTDSEGVFGGGGYDPATGDFIQIVGTLDIATDTVTLYVNGTEVASATSTTGSIGDWDGGDASALGTVGGNNMGGWGSGAQGFSSYAGQIAAMRLYTGALGETAINQNFAAVVAGGQTEVTISTVEDQIFGNAVELGIATVVEGNDVTFGGTVDADPASLAAGALTVNSTNGGTTAFNGEIGGNSPLSALVTNSDGNTTMNAADVRLAGTVLFGDDFTATQALRVEGASVTFGGTAGFADDLDLVATGDAAFVGAVTLGGTSSVNGGNITFDSLVDSATGTTQDLLLASSGITTLNGAIGSLEALASLTTDRFGRTDLGANVTVSGVGGISFNDAVVLISDAVVSSGNAAGAVVFGGLIESASGTAHNLAVNTPGGATTYFLGSIGADILGGVSNDAGIGGLVTDAPGEVVFGPNQAPDIVTGSLAVNFDAGRDSDGPPTWESTTENQSRNWALPLGVVPVNTPAHQPGLGGAYRFNGQSATGTAYNNFLSTSDNSVELWIRPSDLIGKEILFETGGTGLGYSIQLDDADVIFAAQQASDNAHFVRAEGAITSTTDFTQIIAVWDDLADVDPDTDGNQNGSSMRLYVNGVEVGSKLNIADFNSVSGSDGAGLGGANAAHGGGSAVVDGTALVDSGYGAYSGDIAVMRVYQQMLNPSQVQQNYAAVAETPQIVRTVNDQSYHDQAVVARNILFEGANVTFNDTLNGQTSSPDVTIATTGNGLTTFAGDVGDTQTIGSLVTNFDGRTEIHGDVFSDGDRIVFFDSVLLRADVEISQSGPGDVVFANTLDSADGDNFDLTVSNPGGGRAVFAADVGSDALGALSADAGLGNIVTDDAVVGGFVPVSPGTQLNYEANLDDGTDAIWENTSATHPDQVNLELDPALNFVAVAGGTTITHAYDFPGGTAADTAPNDGTRLGAQFNSGLGSTPGGDGGQVDATFEMWFKPDTLAGGNQFLMETGGGTGIGLYLNNSTLQLRRAGGGTNSNNFLAYDIGGLEGDFIQVVGVNEIGGDLILYVNGEEVDRGVGAGGTDWDGGDAAALGTKGGANAGGLGGGNQNRVPFDGQIAIYREYHGQALSGSEAENNFYAVSGGKSVSITTVEDQTYQGAVTVGGDAVFNAEDVVTQSTVALGANDLTVNVSGTDSEAQGIVDGTGGLIKQGSGTLTLSAANTYTGTTDIEAGTLVVNGEIGNGGTPGTIGRVTIASGATLGGGGTVNAPVFSSAADGNILAGGDLVLGDGSASGFDFEGVLTVGSHTVTIVDSNEALLGSSTAVDGGTLVAANGLLMSGGDELSGNGTVDADLDAGAGTVTPGEVGDPTQTLAIGNLVFGAAGTLVVQLDGTSTPDIDLLDITGQVDLTNGPTLDIAGTVDPALGAEIVFVSNDGTDAVLGTFAGLVEGEAVMIAGNRFHITYAGGDGNDVALVRNRAPEITFDVENTTESVTTTLSGRIDHADGADSHIVTIDWDDPNAALDSVFDLPRTRDLVDGQEILSRDGTAILTVVDVNHANDYVEFEVGHIYIDDGPDPGLNASATYVPEDGTASNSSDIVATVSDDESLGDNGGATVTISNVAPVPATDSAATDEDSRVTIDLLAGATDQSPLDDIFLDSIDTAGTKGSVVINADNRTVTYDPRAAFQNLSAGETVTDTFRYTLIDDDGGMTVQEVTVTITGNNDAPVLTVDTGDVHEGGVGGPEVLAGNVLANDSDVDLSGAAATGSLSVQRVVFDGEAFDGSTNRGGRVDANGVLRVDGAHGTLTISADGSFVYTLDSELPATRVLRDGDRRVETFSYTVVDGLGGQVTERIRITVHGADGGAIGDLFFVGGSGILEGFRFAEPGSLFDRDGDSDDSPILTRIPTYSGSAAPGSVVTVRVLGIGGAYVPGGATTVVTDVSGGWIATMNGLVPGNVSYFVQIEQSPPTWSAGTSSVFRTFYAPAINGATGDPGVTSVESIFGRRLNSVGMAETINANAHPLGSNEDWRTANSLP